MASAPDTHRRAWRLCDAYWSGAASILADPMNLAHALPLAVYPSTGGDAAAFIEDRPGNP